jgi:hypothetical protein
LKRRQPHPQKMTRMAFRIGRKAEEKLEAAHSDRERRRKMAFRTTRSYLAIEARARGGNTVYTMRVLLRALIMLCAMLTCCASHVVSGADAKMPTSKGGEYVMNFGRYRGHKLRDIPSSYCECALVAGYVSFGALVCLCACAHVCMRLSDIHLPMTRCVFSLHLLRRPSYLCTLSWKDSLQPALQYSRKTCACSHYATVCKEPIEDKQAPRPHVSRLRQKFRSLSFLSYPEKNLLLSQ